MTPLRVVDMYIVRGLRCEAAPHSQGLSCAAVIAAIAASAPGGEGGLVPD